YVVETALRADVALIHADRADTFGNLDYVATAQNFNPLMAMAAPVVIAEAERLGKGCDLYEITGGEPLLQKPVHELMAKLCDMGRTVLIETSGACDISVCDPRVIRIMDLKTPGSGEAQRNLWSNIEHLNERDEVKFVLCSREDYEWARGVIREHKLAERVAAVLVSATHETPPGKELPGCTGLPLHDLAQWVLEDNLPVR
ncbi:MAG: hypothetical protein KDA30_15750, partial [Phycisphaerales bacterium]|nr:hypothetical protein [Phycisphaerales bacterium]